MASFPILKNVVDSNQHIFVIIIYVQSACGFMRGPRLAYPEKPVPGIHVTDRVISNNTLCLLQQRLALHSTAKQYEASPPLTFQRTIWQRHRTRLRRAAPRESNRRPRLPRVCGGWLPPAGQLVGRANQGPLLTF